MKIYKRLSVLFLFPLFLFFLSLNCSDASQTDQLTDYLNDSDYPQDYWKTSTPSVQGMDEGFLEEMIDKINDENYEIHSLLIIKNGYLVFERYGITYTPDNIHELNSTTKSFVSALFGIAVKEGFVSGVEDKMLNYFSDITVDNLTTDKKNITVKDLLCMRSGLEWNDQEIISDYFNAENAVKYILDRPMTTAPDTAWHYNSGSSHLLSAIITGTTGKSAADYAEIKLFAPLGIKNYEWSSDRQHINHGGLGLSLKPRDMAKFGYLYLCKGKWNNEQIISEDWVSTSTSVHSDTYWAGNYGYHWWIKNDDCFASQGAYGQNIYVYPEKDIVIVYTAGLPVEKADETLLQLTSDYIIPAIK
ncbi:MAG: serine hydrolase [Spirochaetes bacterium]|nr:serine hydrolase [Spirochaetota bacterium]